MEPNYRNINYHIDFDNNIVQIDYNTFPFGWHGGIMSFLIPLEVFKLNKCYIKNVNQKDWLPYQIDNNVFEQIFEKYAYSINGTHLRLEYAGCFIPIQWNISNYCSTTGERKQWINHILFQ